jgi:AcrR family transcriptional regulator
MSLRRPSRKEKQAHTRTCLLKSAQASIDEVAQDAGFTKGAFYANFKSKEEMFLVMLDDKFAAEIELLDELLSGGDDHEQQARRAGEHLIRFVRADSEWPKLFFEFAAYAARNDDFRQELLTRVRALRQRMLELFRRSSASFPAEPPVPLADVTVMTYCMANGFLMEQLIDPDLNDELYGSMLAIFLRGLAATAVGWEPPARVAEPAGP